MKALLPLTSLLLLACSPAKTNCSDYQASTSIQLTNGASQQIEVCVFDDNRQCALSALQAGYCSLPRKLTGYPTAEERYCAIFAGRIDNQQCQLPNGQSLSLQQWYQLSDYGQ